MPRPAIIVAGPTCSGKSALAMVLAERFGGVVINADAMQCYADLRVLTARPTPQDEARVPHALYGTAPVAPPVTAASWRAAVLALLQADARLPVLCGGTGLYLHALLRGIAEIPDPGERARAEARALLAELGPAGLHTRLAAHDPQTAGRLRPTDAQRLARAWEVWAGTGLGLSAWQARAATSPPPVTPYAVVLLPERDRLRAGIAERWHQMVGQGALEEVARLRTLARDPSLPVLRAHGVPELGAVLDGTMGMDEAGKAAVTAIGRYTRRQATWLRHHDLADASQTLTIRARWEDKTQFSFAYMAGMSEFMSRVG